MGALFWVDCFKVLETYLGDPVFRDLAFLSVKGLLKIQSPYRSPSSATVSLSMFQLPTVSDDPKIPKGNFRIEFPTTYHSEQHDQILQHPTPSHPTRTSFAPDTQPPTSPQLHDPGPPKADDAPFDIMSGLK